MAVRRTRSAPSLSRTSTAWRNQLLRRSGEWLAVGRASRSKGGGGPEESSGGRTIPWERASGAVNTFRTEVDVDIVSLDHRGVGAHIVGEGVERAAGGEVEAGVVPVAGQQAIADGSPV